MNDAKRQNDNLIAMIKGRIAELTQKQKKLIEDARENGAAIYNLQNQLRELEGK